MIGLFNPMIAGPLTLTWLLIYLTGLLWSLANPHDYFTWFLEAAPALIALLLLTATYKSFPLTPLAYTLILVHCLILFLGAHYTYAQVDAFKIVRDYFGWQRNNYDKVGHFAQGFGAGNHRAGSFATPLSGERARLAQLVRDFDLLGIQRFVRNFRVDCRSRDRRLGRRLSRHARLCLGHTVRHGNGPAGRNFGSEFVEPTPRPAIGSPRQ